MELSELSVLVSGLDHPEGVAFGQDGKLYAGGESGQVYRIDMDAKTHEQIASTGGFCLGMALDAAGNLYVCDMGLAAVMRVTPTGETAVYSKGPAERPFSVPNFPVFDAQGNLYVSNSGNWGQKNGLIYRVAPGGAATVWSEAAADYTNGLALSPDGRYLYVVESALPGIARIGIAADGQPDGYEVVVRLPQTVPDGIAFDAAGNLYIACYAPDRVYRYTPSGTLETLWDDWSRLTLNAPTNLAFAGKNLDVLVLASLGGWSLAAATLPVKGQALHYPSF